ncbi:MAG: thermonuclease family protein [Candidatus Magnetoovum sp. WYHC-5]|nr:thermonuclease family protein [Candidatus Magnetoovum sp. WYHC-5]
MKKTITKRKTKANDNPYVKVLILLMFFMYIFHYGDTLIKTDRRVKAVERGFNAVVVKVYKGVNIVVRENNTGDELMCVLFGIRLPEFLDKQYMEPIYGESVKTIKNVVKGKQVAVYVTGFRVDSSETCIIKTPDVDVNESLLLEGLVIVQRAYIERHISAFIYDKYLSIERRARLNKRGIWEVYETNTWQYFFEDRRLLLYNYLKNMYTQIN